MKNFGFEQILTSNPNPRLQPGRSCRCQCVVVGRKVSFVIFLHSTTRFEQYRLLRDIPGIIVPPSSRRSRPLIDFCHIVFFFIEWSEGDDVRYRYTKCLRQPVYLKVTCRSKGPAILRISTGVPCVILWKTQDHLLDSWLPRTKKWKLPASIISSRYPSTLTFAAQGTKDLIQFFQTLFDIPSCLAQWMIVSFIRQRRGIIDSSLRYGQQLFPTYKTASGLSYRPCVQVLGCCYLYRLHV
ncbi:hypothetical protein BDV36DRAFT_247563 [Aspergillus pseudocaelatus]|uniref:Uncharacterized protein n=1 Tax=Aspergillus pseudocaelatus TaxID=1825620 RepID=A0ABQ6WWU7_9EURO|nr:hypothetical protein BDV36DRAFT_247563 [Aspergillus pseudocaelatus]